MEFYTYLWLREDGTPYYVGKGRDRRAYTNQKGHRPPKDHERIVMQFWDDEDTALAYEKYQIDFWGRKDIGTGILINHTDGGDGLANPSEELKLSISKRMMGNKHGLGSTHTPEVRKAISERMKGIQRIKPGTKLPKEWCEAIGNGNRGRKQSEEANKAQHSWWNTEKGTEARKRLATQASAAANARWHRGDTSAIPE